jgi:hypothetical protein
MTEVYFHEYINQRMKALFCLCTAGQMLVPFVLGPTIFFVLRFLAVIIFDPLQRHRIFPLPSASRPALGPTQPPVQWVPGALCPGVKRGRDVMLTTHPLLVPRLRKSRSCTSCHPNAPLWSVTGPLYLFFNNNLW